MARLRLVPGTRYRLHGQVFIIREVLLMGKLRVENLTFGSQLVVSEDELYQAWNNGELEFEARGPNTRIDPDVGIATGYKLPDFSVLPEHQQAEARRRFELIRPLLAMHPNERTKKRIQEYADKLVQEMNLAVPPDGRRKRGAIGESVSRASLERWLRAYRTSGQDIRSLVPATHESGGKGESRLHTKIEEIIKEVLDECSSKPAYRTAYDVWLMVVKKVGSENAFRDPQDKLKPPSSVTVYQRIRQRKDSHILRRRLSRLEAQANADVQPVPKLTRILQRVEIDSTTLDIFLVDTREDQRLPIGRPTLTFALESYSGMPFGLYTGFEPSSYLTVMSCLENGILMKPDVQSLYGTRNPWPVFGLPEQLIVDNGKEFIGRDLQDACDQLGIELKPMPVQSAWFKGAVERYFRTNNTGLLHTLPGTTFSNIVDRGDYDPLKHACMSLEAFTKVLHIFLLDIYAQRWNEGRQGIPFRRWHESASNGWTPDLNLSAKDIRRMLGRTAERVASREGIELWTLRYKNADYIRMRDRLPAGAKVRIKYDPRDVSKIEVLDPTLPGGPDWITVEAIDQDYTKGLYLKAHHQIRSYVLRTKGEVDIYALAEAKHYIQQVVEEEFKLTRRASRSRTRKKSTQFLDRTGHTGRSEQPDAKGLSVTAHATVQTGIIPGDADIVVLEDASDTIELALQSPAQKKTRGRPRKQSTTRVVAAPVGPSVDADEDDDELDMTGYGSDRSGA